MIIGQIKDRNSQIYDVDFYQDSSDFPHCIILMHKKMIKPDGSFSCDSNNEVVRFSEAIWREVGYHKKWLRKPKEEK